MGNIIFWTVVKTVLLHWTTSSPDVVIVQRFEINK